VNSDLDRLASSYARLSKDVGGRIDFCCDLNSDDALNVALLEKDHLDQAFFILSFAALEKQITLLASANEEEQERRRAMRASPFEKRLESAVRVAYDKLGASPDWTERESDINSWYRVRNDIAHGDSPTRLFDVPPVIALADRIASTLEQVTGATSIANPT
jgi:hypothetical protein